MRAKLFSALLFMVLVPGTALADRPAVTSVKDQVILLTVMVQELNEKLEKTRSELATTQAELAAIKSNTVLGLDGLLQLTQDANGFNTVLFSGANVQVINGNGATDSSNGLGNIVIGYNKSNEVFIDRNGSHNIILGDEQTYPDTEEVLTNKILSNRDLEVIVASNMNVFVGDDQTTTIGKNSAISIGKDKTQTIGGNESIAVGVDRNVAVGSNQAERINGTADMIVGNDVSLNFGRDMSMNVGKKMLVTAVDELLYKSGTASGIFKKNGDITIQGKDITIKASGDLVLKGSKILEN